MALLELQVDEVFTLEEGFASLQRDLAAERRIELVNLPVHLLREWASLLQGKQVTIYDNLLEGLPADVRGLGKEVFTAVRMQGTLFGRVVEKGEVFLRHKIYNLWYTGDQIHHIGSITYRRCVKCIQAMHREIMHEERPEVLNIMTLYEPEAGIEAILRAVESSSRVRMVNLPKQLVRRIVVHFDAQDIKILCAERSDQARKVADQFQARVSGSLLNVYSRYKGKKVKSGGLALDRKFFSVNYLDETIYLVLGLEWPRCPRCMTDFYELGWRAAGRIR